MKKCKKHIIFTYFVAVSLLLSASAFSQEKDSLAIKKQYQKLVYNAQKNLADDNFPLAEANLRKAIALQPNDAVAKYNLGTASYNEKLNGDAQLRFKQAAGVAKTKKEKHKAYHNLGNTFMNDKNYKAAVEAYKNALRNNPKDDETRYNLALAKKLLEEQQKKGGGGDDDNKDKNKDQKDKDNKNKNKDNKENKDQNKDNKDQKDGDKKDDKNDKGKDQKDKKEDDKDKDKGKPDDKKGDQKKKTDKGDKKQEKPMPGKLSPQQIKSILQAMNNEEKKIQKKINAKKEKGVKIKTDKDW